MNCLDSHYDEVAGRLRGVLIATSDLLSSADVKIVSDYLDYNELGLALESLAEALATNSSSASNETIKALHALASEMKMDYDVASVLGRRPAT